MLSGYTERWTWPYRPKYEQYQMIFMLQAVEIVRKRNKKQQPCNENWNEYDDWVINRFQNKTKCNTPYHEEEKNLPICNTQQLMVRFLSTSMYIPYIQIYYTMQNFGQC